MQSSDQRKLRKRSVSTYKSEWNEDDLLPDSLSDNELVDQDYTPNQTHKKTRSLRGIMAYQAVTRRQTSSRIRSRVRTRGGCRGYIGRIGMLQDHRQFVETIADDERMDMFAAPVLKPNTPKLTKGS